MPESGLEISHRALKEHGVVKERPQFFRLDATDRYFKIMNYGGINTFCKFFFTNVEPQAVEVVQEDDGIVADGTKMLLEFFTNGDPVVGLGGDYDACMGGGKGNSTNKNFIPRKLLEIRPSGYQSSGTAYFGLIFVFWCHYPPPPQSMKV